ncbi:MAG: hypothetical protein ACOYBS_08665 [Flavobacterium sp.]
MENSNKKYQKPDAISKVEEPALEYTKTEKLETEIEYHPVLESLILNAIKESEEGKSIPHEEVMRRLKERYPFLNGV